MAETLPAVGLVDTDILIDAAHGIPLYTRNVRHFRSIPHLTVLAPY